jgi:protein tyrosine phosphatase (PTP) superfamily phosphohydrolase (DUF442 family)
LKPSKCRGIFFYVNNRIRLRVNRISIRNASFQNIQESRVFSQQTARRSYWPKSLILMLFLCISAPHLSRFLHAESESRSATKIRNFGRINDNNYRGGQPTQGDLAALKKLGVRTVIDLQKNDPTKEASWAQDAGLKYFRIPLSSSRPAIAEQTEYFLELVNDPAHWPVFVHCAGGRHRTGAMTAIYRITHDSWTADQAYREMEKYGYYSFPNHGSLKDYVYRYFRDYLGTKGKSKTSALYIPICVHIP